MTSHAPGEELAARDYWTIFAVSAAVMLYQIALIRVLSVVVWYHFAFLTISLVMLGLGAPGVWFALAKRPLRHLPHLLLASGLAIPLSIAVLVAHGADLRSRSVLWLVACVLPATLSLGGVVCAVLIKATGRRITAVYGVDLLGAGLGALLVIPLMSSFPTPHLAAATALLPLLSLAQYGRGNRVVALSLAGLLVGALAVGRPFEVTHSKAYDESLVPPVYEEWSPIARITVFDDRFFYLDDHPGGFSWGRGTRFPAERAVRQYWLEQDGSAGTPIIEYSGDAAQIEHLLYDVTSVGYQLRPPTRAAIIGAGGGRDILSALMSGARGVDAVELNPVTIEVVSEHFGWLSGDPYGAPGVRAIAREGRSHLTHTDASFDLIQISLVDSWAASTVGAFALAENNLYTVEAFELYLARLGGAGILSTSRWLTELPRLVVLARATLEKLGLPEPQRHLMAVSAGKVATLLMSRRPFDARDVARLDEICAERGFTRLFPVAAGESPPRPLIADLATVGPSVMAAMGLNVAPPSDDSPYFFHLVSPFRDLGTIDRRVLQHAGGLLNVQSTQVLQQAMSGVAGLAVVLFLLPFVARVAPSQRRLPVGRLARATLFFAAIGCAFMLFENVLVQRFVLYLGHPSYATTVIIASLLLGMGAGSIGAERLGLARLRRGGWIVPGVLAALVVVLPPLFAGTLGLPLALRVGLTSLILLPLGAVLGVFFPLGMLHFGDTAKPWYWAINGAFGVVASVMSLALSMDFGFSSVGLLAAAGYAVAWLCLLGPAAPEDPGDAIQPR